MAFYKENAECPFCRSKSYQVNLYVEDMPASDRPTELENLLTLVCTECGKSIFAVSKDQGGVVSASGVSICRKCSSDRSSSIHSWREKECPDCRSSLEKRWWSGPGYTV